MGNYLGKETLSQSDQNPCLRFLIYNLYKIYASFWKINYNTCSSTIQETGLRLHRKAYTSSMAKLSDKTQETIRNCTEVLDFKSNFD